MEKGATVNKNIDVNISLFYNVLKCAKIQNVLNYAFVFIKKNLCKQESGGLT